MITVRFGAGVSGRVPEGSSVLEASQAAGLPHAHACGGRALCTTCRVRIEDGHASCPPARPREQELLRMKGLGPDVRLACQLRPRGDVTVTILIADHRSPSRRTPRAVQEDVAVLFADLRGFTSFAERQLPFDVASVLNRYFDLLGVLVEAHEGHILDYLGDGVMTLFRPGPAEAPARRALVCALELASQCATFQAYVHEHFAATLDVGAAVHCGRAVVGRLGYFRDRHLNAVGDVLNATARLEDLNRDLATQVLVSEDALAAGGDLPAGAELGSSFAVKVRGRRAPLTAYAVRVGPPAG